MITSNPKQVGLTVHWAYISLPGLQLEYWQSQENLYDHCLVVANETTRTVIQCNACALRQGIKPGMGLADAWLISEGLLHQYYSAEREATLLNALATQLYNHFAEIAIDYAYCGLWLQLKSLKRLFSNTDQIESMVESQLTYDVGDLSYELTFASNPCLAQLGIDDSAKQLAGVIDGYPVQRTYLSPGTQHKLISMGLDTLDKINQIPVSTLGRKLGHEVVRFLTELRGEVTRSFTYFRPGAVFYQSRQLNSEVYTWSSLRFACKSLLQVLEQSLNASQQSTQRVTLWLYGRNFQGNAAVLPSSDSPAIERVQIELARPAWKADDFFSILQLKMETVRFQQPVVDIAIQVAATEPRVIEHGLLYSNQQNQADLDLLFNRLQARVGQQRVYSIECTSSWLPERQQRSADVAHSSAGNVYPNHGWRPPWLVEAEPINIDVWAISSQLQRLTVPWWYHAAPSLSHRDYIVAQHANGRWGWIFYQVADGSEGWYLQGWVS